MGVLVVLDSKGILWENKEDGAGRMGKNSDSRLDCNIILGDQACKARRGVGTVMLALGGTKHTVWSILCSMGTDESPMLVAPHAATDGHAT